MHSRDSRDRSSGSQLELKVIADVGLVGFPNVGKSTLLIPCYQRKTEDCKLSFYDVEPTSGRG